MHFTVRKRSFPRLCFYTRVPRILSTGGGCLGPHPGWKLKGLTRGSRPTPRRGLRGSGQGGTSRHRPRWEVGGLARRVSRPTEEDTPPLQTATAADDTHPTGMHSCLFHFIFVWFSVKYLR